MLDEALEHIKNNQPVLTKISGDDKVILQYGDVTDSSGRVDVEAFAMTRGRTITLNRFMYDDTDYLIKQYDDSVKSRHFTQGTAYRNIIDHEMGHVFVNCKSKTKYSRIIEHLVQQKANLHGLKFEEYITDYISIYANKENELISELNAMYNGKHKGVSEELLRKVGLL